MITLLHLFVFTVSEGDRIAQLICEKAIYPIVVEDEPEFNESHEFLVPPPPPPTTTTSSGSVVRGCSGFGSTGK